MSNIYRDQHLDLKDVLTRAGSIADATLLIPDLQRPYVWLPIQVIALVDSLIRGWPFGTLLTWRVSAHDPVRQLARPFWSVVDRTSSDTGTQLSGKNPPAQFQMILDGQQRVQSLLMAFGADGSGFKLLDRQWREFIGGARRRGPRGKDQWSLGTLCLDVPSYVAAYAEKGRATAVEYSSVLQWVITNDTLGQSTLTKPSSDVEPLQKASEFPGRFIRLTRLWAAAPDTSVGDPYSLEAVAEKLLSEHGFEGDVPGKRLLRAVLLG